MSAYQFKVTESGNWTWYLDSSTNEVFGQTECIAPSHIQLITELIQNHVQGMSTQENQGKPPPSDGSKNQQVSLAKPGSRKGPKTQIGDQKVRNRERSSQKRTISPSANEPMAKMPDTTMPTNATYMPHRNLSVFTSTNT